MKSGHAASRGRNSRANVVFPAPFGPAMITIFFWRFLIEQILELNNLKIAMLCPECQQDAQMHRCTRFHHFILVIRAIRSTR
jgi:hypothetical protein